MALRGPEEKAAAVTVAGEPLPGRHDGNASVRQNDYPSDGQLPNGA